MDLSVGERSMTAINLIAIDPGKASGFVVLDITETFATGARPIILYSGEPEQQETCAWVDSFLSDPDNDAKIYIVMEDFLITPETGKKKDTRYSLEIIGAVRYLAKLHGIPFALQTSSNAKSFAENDRIRSMGLWVPGGEGHAKDAMRHAILYMVKALHLKPEGLIIPG